jgi:hypothetical protein
MKMRCNEIGEGAVGTASFLFECIDAFNDIFIYIPVKHAELPLKHFDYSDLW